MRHRLRLWLRLEDGLGARAFVDDNVSQIANQIIVSFLRGTIATSRGISLAGCILVNNRTAAFADVSEVFLDLFLHHLLITILYHILQTSGPILEAGSFKVLKHDEYSQTAFCTLNLIEYVTQMPVSDLLLHRGH